MPTTVTDALTISWAAPSDPSVGIGAPAVPIATTDRYADRGPIARGGMGEVRRVRDRRLDCDVAMKVLLLDLVHDADARRRFVTEGTLTAQLRHPGIVAVHDRGELPDRRLWYTMTEVRGGTLGDLLADTDTPADPVGLRRVVGLLRRVCDAVAYAHDRGVLHRDLKPANIMVGAFGELLVMDWGLAVRERDLDEAPGTVVGTPAFMAPEQLRGQVDAQGPWTDVYALGAILHVILTGRTLFEGLHGPSLAPPFADGVPPGLPTALVELCRTAMAPDPYGRLSDAGALGSRLEGWLDGAERRARALASVQRASALVPRLFSLRDEAAARLAAAEATLDGLPRTAPVSAKAEAWIQQDEARAMRLEASVLEAQWLQDLGAALAEAPDLAEAHAMLADHYAASLREAEARRDHEGVARLEVHLARHDGGAHAALLSGVGAVTVVTDPPGAEVRAHRLVEQGRRLTPVFHAILGTTPLREVSLPRGSWLLELVKDGHDAVRYPVFLGRGESWDGVAPGDGAPTPVLLPRTGELGPEDCYVPAGPFWCGGDPHGIEPVPRRSVWVDAFVVERFPVRIGVWLAWLDELQSRGEHALVEQLLPRTTGLQAPERALIDLSERPWCVRSESGAERDSQEPVTSIDAAAAAAFAAWRHQVQGLPWRLPNELEWEKAARGVDARWYPWGDQFEPQWANVLNYSDALPGVRPVGAVPEDVSVYGVRDLAGNVRDWCANRWSSEGPAGPDGRLPPPRVELDAPLLVERGGCFFDAMASTRCATRFADPPDARHHSVGVRLVRSYTAVGRSTARK